MYSISSAARDPDITAMWTAEPERVGSDWSSIVSLHLDVCDRLRPSTVTCETSGGTHCRNPPFCAICRDADARKVRGAAPRYIEAERWQKPSDSIPENWNEMSIEALTAHFIRARRRDGAAASTVEAPMLSLRERGTKALEEPNVRRRLSDMDEMQLREVGARLQNLKPHIASAWDADAVVFLISTWANLKNGQC
jgi:hypothetical protein